MPIMVSGKLSYRRTVANLLHVPSTCPSADVEVIAEDLGACGEDIEQHDMKADR